MIPIAMAGAANPDVTATLVRTDRVLTSDLDAGVVMMDMDQGVYYALENTAARFWALTEQPITVGAMCDRLVAEYDITPEQCIEQVLAFAGQLRERGLLRIDS